MTKHSDLFVCYSVRIVTSMALVTISRTPGPTGLVHHGRTSSLWSSCVIEIPFPMQENTLLKMTCLGYFNPRQRHYPRCPSISAIALIVEFLLSSLVDGSYSRVANQLAC
jgi:hypothetical protein